MVRPYSGSGWSGSPRYSRRACSMNALLLDHLDTDLGMVNLLNDVFRSGIAAYGSDFVERLDQAALVRGGHRFRPIETLVVRPTAGVGELAAEHLRSGRL